MILLSSGALVSVSGFLHCLKVDMDLREGGLRLGASKILWNLIAHFSKQSTLSSESKSYQWSWWMCIMFWMHFSLTQHTFLCSDTSCLEPSEWTHKKTSWSSPMTLIRDILLLRSCRVLGLSTPYYQPWALCGSGNQHAVSRSLVDNLACSLHSESSLLLAKIAALAVQCCLFHPSSCPLQGHLDRKISTSA